MNWEKTRGKNPKEASTNAGDKHYYAQLSCRLLSILQ